MYAPDTDGIDHINVYSKGKTQLGKLLTNFAYTPFIYEPYGNFNTVEGFWYYYLTDCKYPELKELYGFKAKVFGRKCEGYREPNDTDKTIILKALHCKLKQNKNILLLLKHSNLIFTHYYAYGNSHNYKIYNQSKHMWLIDEFIRIRTLIQK